MKQPQTIDVEHLPNDDEEFEDILLYEDNNRSTNSYKDYINKIINNNKSIDTNNVNNNNNNFESRRNNNSDNNMSNRNNNRNNRNRETLKKKGKN